MPVKKSLQVAGPLEGYRLHKYKLLTALTGEGTRFSDEAG